MRDLQGYEFIVANLLMDNVFLAMLVMHMPVTKAVCHVYMSRDPFLEITSPPL